MQKRDPGERFPRGNTYEAAGLERGEEFREDFWDDEDGEGAEGVCVCLGGEVEGLCFGLEIDPIIE